MKYLRYALWPFSLLYGLVVVIRNWCYDTGWFKSTMFDLPLITIGNLAVGGAGKSPMTEYLIRLLKTDYKVATLSRGYGRQTKGFVLATANSTAQQIGDEPAQFKHKFQDITVAVCEDRVVGVTGIKDNVDIVLLDDAFQHRAIKSGLSILLFDYNKLQVPRLLLPAGSLREPFSGKMRADVLIISKCPAGISASDQQLIAQQINPYPYQLLFFTGIDYLPLQPFTTAINLAAVNTGTTIFLLTGIADTGPLERYFTQKGCTIILHKYPDHHAFTLKNIVKLADDFDALPSTNKIIVTTEKDAERLRQPQLQALLKPLPVAVQPIGVVFLNNGKAQFDKMIENYVTKY